MSRRAALGLAALGLGLGALVLALWWHRAGSPGPRAPVATAAELPPLSSDLADQALPLVWARLQGCAEGLAPPTCQGQPLLAFRLRAENGVAYLGELQVRRGELAGPLMTCLGRALGEIRLPSPQPRGELVVEAPVTCLDGRPRPLPVRTGGALSAGEAGQADPR